MVIVAGWPTRDGGSRGGGIGRTFGLGFELVADGLFFCSPGFFLGRLAGFGFAAARFLGGGEDRNRLLLAPFGFAPGSVALLLDQGALARGLFGGGQCAAGTGSRTAWLDYRPWCGGRTGWWRRRCTRGGRRVRQGRTLLAHFHLHDL
jgi:hypothetical protein